MERYDYETAVENDVKQWIDDNINIWEWKGNKGGLEKYLNNELWTDDSVTGNGSATYTASSWQAEENLCHNMGLLEEALDAFGEYWDTNILEKGAEWCDVTIRCHLLPIVIGGILNCMENDGFFEEEETEAQ